MIGKLDKEIIEKFKEFQEKTGKHSELYIEDVEFEKIYLNDDNYFEINPKKSEIHTELFTRNIDVSFVPLHNINAKTGILNSSETRKINDVKKGYTYFKEGDVIFTKVTPSMENGNFAIAKGLVNGIGFGSSEYYVFRCKKVHNKLLWFLFRTDHFREKAKKTMRGSGGLKRVPLDFFSTQYIPIPKDLNKFYSSYQIQEAIVEFLEFWKEGYTDLVRENTNKKISIYKTIKKLVVKNTFKYDEFLVDNFDKFAKEKGYDISLQKIEFVEYDFFKKNNKNLFLPKKLEKNQQLILENSVEDGVPVYSGGKEKLCDVDKNRYLNKVFIPNEDNPDISFANNGDGSAGKNFFIHTKPYFVNQERTVISFKNDDEHYSLYVYYLIQDMRDKYNMNRENRPTPKDLPKFGIKIQKPLPVHEYSSKDLQHLLVEFWQTIIKQIDKNLSMYNRMLELADIIDKAFLYRTFSEIEWSKNE